MTAPGRILVVDDEPGIRSFLAECLELDGHTVLQAADGQKALAVLAKESVQVVLSDHRMPGMDGSELLRRIRAEQPEIEVIMVTAHGTVDTAVEAMKLGAFDYLQKPLSGPAEVRMLVARALERHRLRALQEVTHQEGTPSLTYGAPAMAPVSRALQKVAETQATVLLLGESGSGKEVAAQALHRWSKRADGPFVAVNCAALSADLLESELFGHERGAFTGANDRRRGKIELASSGTFFLDEVGELAPPLQAKLLRVLQEKSFERVGGNQSIVADVRWVAATNRDLAAMVSNGTFREDLYHRLAVFPIALPPLRERPEDIEPLARHLLARASASLGRPGLRLDESALASLRASPWPGNIRQLANALERAAILADGECITAEHLTLMPGVRPPGGDRHGSGPRSLADIERTAIEDALRRHKGNRKKAAEELGIGVRTLYDKLKRWSQ